MKVQVFNPEGKSVDTLQNVVNIKDCADGRKLVTYEKECTCCTVVSRYVFQVPAMYRIKVLVEDLDEVSIISYRRQKVEIKKGDNVIIKGSAEEMTYKGCVFEVLSEPYNICGSETVKMKCHETGKYFGGGYATKFLEVKKNV